MNPTATYTRPPIVETLLDIQVDLPGDFQLEKLLKCQNDVKNDYPEMQKKNLGAMQVSFGQGVSSSASMKPHGYVFIAPDKKQLFQARLDGFSFHRLSPYQGWDAFTTEAQRLWQLYRQIGHPQGYKRITIRTINRFDFSSPTVLLETYFRTFPQVSSDLPQLMNGFFFQFNLPLPEIQSEVTITETAVDPPTPDRCSILLDIELYRTANLTGSELWSIFPTMRIWKNKVFEACITKSAQEMIL